MATLHEISLFAGLVVSGLFYFQYKRYENEARKQDLLDSFLKNDALKNSIG